MPFMSKPNTRQTGTPSPTPGDLLNTLLVVKDTVNTTLLNEHTRLADLSNVLSEVEDQIRNAVEQTIKNLKIEFEKRRRKIVPGIKKLQDSLKSLSKSESRFKASDKFCKNADAKKAKRRIKDAQKTLHDFTATDIELGVATFVADQITLFCQQVMQVPPKITKNEVKYESIDTHRIEKSDSDSEGSSRVNTPTNHIYSEIDVSQSRNSTYIHPRRSTCLFLEETDSKKDAFDKGNKGSPVPRLNSVVLFSSDSEEDYGFGNRKKKHHVKRPKSAGSGSRQSRSNKKSNSKKSKSPDYEILDKPTCKDLFREVASNSLSPSRLGQSGHIMSLSPVLYDDYEKPIKREHERLGEPIKEYMKRMSPASKTENTAKELAHSTYDKSASIVTTKETFLSNSSVSKTNDELSLSSARTIPKRLLPATPRHVFENTEELKHENTVSQRHFISKFLQNADETDASLLEDTTDSVSLLTANNTVELLNAAQDFLADSEISDRFNGVNRETEYSKPEEKCTEISTQTNSLDNDYIDLEEIKFRETVRSARREIIDKLKSKYTHSGNTSSVLDKDNNTEVCHSETALRTHANISQDLNLYDQNFSYESGSNDTDKTTENYDSSSYNTTEEAKEEKEGLYRSKLIYTYITNNQIGLTREIEKPENVSNSLVTSTIKMFEQASSRDEHVNIFNNRARKQKPVVKYGVGARYRSVSEPRTSVSSIKEKSQNHISNLRQPTKALQPRTQILNLNSSGTENGSISSSDSSNLARSCTENDLLNLVRNESSSSIRKQWSKRRSSSMTPRINDSRQIQGPTYEHWLSFEIPEQRSRCFISAIVVLDDRSIVLLDERHSVLYLFYLYEGTFKQIDQYRLLDIPKSCVKVKPDTVAVAFPYKKCICTYCVKMNAILSENEISVPCKEWIVSVEFSKNLLYVLCKAGEIHIMTDSGTEKHRLCVGMTGILFVPPLTKCIFVLGERRVSKFDTNGSFISSKADMDAHSMIFLENRIYVADRQRHKVVPLSQPTDVQNLIDMKIEYPSAICSSLTGDILLVSQFEESMEMALTRTVRVLKIKRT